MGRWIWLQCPKKDQTFLGMQAGTSIKLAFFNQKHADQTWRLSSEIWSPVSDSHH